MEILFFRVSTSLGGLSDWSSFQISNGTASWGIAYPAVKLRKHESLSQPGGFMQC